MMRDSRLSKLSEVSQIVSAFAVVISLVYVGYEISQNTDATRAATRQAVAETDLGFLSGPLDPALLARAETKRRTGQELSDEEDLVLFERQHLNFRIFENAHYHFEVGLLEAEVWRRHVRIIESNLSGNPHAAIMWERNGSTFTESFQVVVDSVAAELGTR